MPDQDTRRANQHVMNLFRRSPADEPTPATNGPTDREVNAVRDARRTLADRLRERLHRPSG